MENERKRPSNISEFLESYDELYKKVATYFGRHPQLIDRMKLINDEISYIKEEIEDFIDDIDRESFELTQDEEDRIKQKDVTARALKRVSPLMLISLLYESNPEMFSIEPFVLENQEQPQEIDVD